MTPLQLRHQGTEEMRQSLKRSGRRRYPPLTVHVGQPSTGKALGVSERLAPHASADFVGQEVPSSAVEKVERGWDGRTHGDEIRAGKPGTCRRHEGWVHSVFVDWSERPVWNGVGSGRLRGWWQAGKQSIRHPDGGFG